MKIALVVGFMDPVRRALDNCYPQDTFEDRLIFIPNQKNSLEAFRGHLYDALKTADDLLVVLGRPGSQRYLEKAALGIIQGAQEQHAFSFQFEVLGNIYDAAPVVQLVKNFGIDTQPQITSEDIRRKVTHGKIFCASLAGKTSILAALKRAAFCPAAIAECFEEEVIGASRNSNLNSHLKSQAGSHSYLIYAWEGARTITPEAKTAFAAGCVEAQSAAQAVELFRKWITGAS